MPRRFKYFDLQVLHKIWKDWTAEKTIIENRQSQTMVKS